MKALGESRPVYMDCNATTPLDPRVREIVLRYMDDEFGNAGSRTHEYGTYAKQAIQKARNQVADVVDAEPHEVIFTSGATESNNLAILGLAKHGEETGKKHIITTQIEHKAVLEPIEHLGQLGYEITLLKPTRGGWIHPEAVADHIRPDTLLVSIMHVNNETGVIQSLQKIAETMSDSDSFFHVDAAQGFGKDISALRDKRLDLISISGHKIYGPKGIGALIMRKRQFRPPPLTPLMWGGGQERGLRAVTFPVHLIAGLGLAAELAAKEVEKRVTKCVDIHSNVVSALTQVGAEFNVDHERTLPHVLNISIPGLDSEAVMVATKDVWAISNGSACTSQSYEPSHVLRAMGLSDERIRGALRISWCHLSAEPNWDDVVSRIRRLQ